MWCFCRKKSAKENSADESEIERLDAADQQNGDCSSAGFLENQGLLSKEGKISHSVVNLNFTCADSTLNTLDSDIDSSSSNKKDQSVELVSRPEASQGHKNENNSNKTKKSNSSAGSANKNEAAHSSVGSKNFKNDNAAVEISKLNEASLSSSKIFTNTNSSEDDLKNSVMCTSTQTDNGLVSAPIMRFREKSKNETKDLDNKNVSKHSKPNNNRKSKNFDDDPKSKGRQLQQSNIVVTKQPLKNDQKPKSIYSNDNINTDYENLPNYAEKLANPVNKKSSVEIEEQSNQKAKRNSLTPLDLSLNSQKKSVTMSKFENYANLADTPSYDVDQSDSLPLNLCLRSFSKTFTEDLNVSNASKMPPLAHNNNNRNMPTAVDIPNSKYSSEDQLTSSSKPDLLSNCDVSEYSLYDVTSYKNEFFSDTYAETPYSANKYFQHRQQADCNKSLGSNSINGCNAFDKYEWMRSNPKYQQQQHHQQHFPQCPMHQHQHQPQHNPNLPHYSRSNYAVPSSSSYSFNHPNNYHNQPPYSPNSKSPNLAVNDTKNTNRNSCYENPTYENSNPAQGGPPPLNPTETVSRHVYTNLPVVEKENVYFSYDNNTYIPPKNLKKLRNLYANEENGVGADDDDDSTATAAAINSDQPLNLILYNGPKTRCDDLDGRKSHYEQLPNLSDGDGGLVSVATNDEDGNDQNNNNNNNNNNINNDNNKTEILLPVKVKCSKPFKNSSNNNSLNNNNNYNNNNNTNNNKTTLTTTGHKFSQKQRKLNKKVVQRHRVSQNQKDSMDGEVNLSRNQSFSDFTSGENMVLSSTPKKSNNKNNNNNNNNSSNNNKSAKRFLSSLSFRNKNNNNNNGGGDDDSKNEKIKKNGDYKKWADLSNASLGSNTSLASSLSSLSTYIHPPSLTSGLSRNEDYDHESIYGSVPPILSANKRDVTLVENFKLLNECFWYWGPLDVKGAEEVLNNQIDGTFLIRDSSDDGCLVSLSFRSLNATHHTRVKYKNGALTFHIPPSLTSQSPIGAANHHYGNKTSTNNNNSSTSSSSTSSPSTPSLSTTMNIIDFIARAIDDSTNSCSSLAESSNSSSCWLYLERSRPMGVSRVPVKLFQPISSKRCLAMSGQVAKLKQLCRDAVIRLVSRKSVNHLSLPPGLISYLLIGYLSANQVLAC